MCVVSMIGDHYNDKWNTPDYKQIWDNWPEVTKQEFDALKKEVEEMKELLKRAKIYDEVNNEPNCEIENKVAMLKKIAELFNINLDEVFKK